MSLDPRTETAIRNTVALVIDPPLTETQIKGVLRKFTKLVEEGHAEDYSFIEATIRFKKRFKKHEHA